MHPNPSENNQRNRRGDQQQIRKLLHAQPFNE
jgi:hypothetical protein